MMPTFHTKSHSKEQNQDDVLLKELTQDAARLVVFNDEVNTFDWVIESFVKVCRHSTTQAEQLSYIVHFNGKATVKTGDREELIPQKEALQERGISAVIEE
jgi:ATP-dependent Clp protease adaptor protein ClpS